VYVGKDDEEQRLTESKNDRSSDYDRMLLAFLQPIHGARVEYVCPNRNFKRLRRL